MNEELDELRKDLIKYKQLFLHMEDTIYDMQISLNKMVSILDDVLDADNTKCGAV